MLSVRLGALKGDITMRPIYGQKGSNALPLMPFNQLYMAFGSGQESNVDTKLLSEQAENMDRNKYEDEIDGDRDEDEDEALVRNLCGSGMLRLLVRRSSSINNMISQSHASKVEATRYQLEDNIARIRRISGKAKIGELSRNESAVDYPPYNEENHAVTSSHTHANVLFFNEPPWPPWQKERREERRSIPQLKCELTYSDKVQTQKATDTEFIGSSQDMAGIETVQEQSMGNESANSSVNSFARLPKDIVASSVPTSSKLCVDKKNCDSGFQANASSSNEECTIISATLIKKRKNIPNEDSALTPLMVSEKPEASPNSQIEVDRQDRNCHKELKLSKSNESITAHNDIAYANSIHGTGDDISLLGSKIETISAPKSSTALPLLPALSTTVSKCAEKSLALDMKDGNCNEGPSTSDPDTSMKSTNMLPARCIPKCNSNENIELQCYETIENMDLIASPDLFYAGFEIPLKPPPRSRFPSKRRQRFLRKLSRSWSTTKKGRKAYNTMAHKNRASNQFSPESITMTKTSISHGKQLQRVLMKAVKRRRQEVRISRQAELHNMSSNGACPSSSTKLQLGFDAVDSPSTESYFPIAQGTKLHSIDTPMRDICSSNNISMTGNTAFTIQGYDSKSARLTHASILASQGRREERKDKYFSRHSDQFIGQPDKRKPGEPDMYGSDASLSSPVRCTISKKKMTNVDHEIHAKPLISDREKGGDYRQSLIQQYTKDVIIEVRRRSPLEVLAACAAPFERAQSSSAIAKLLLSSGTFSADEIDKGIGAGRTHILMFGRRRQLLDKRRKVPYNTNHAKALLETCGYAFRVGEAMDFEPHTVKRNKAFFMPSSCNQGMEMDTK